LLAQLDDSPAWRGVTRYNLACHHALSGQHERAIGELRKTLQLNPDLTEWSKEDPDFASIRERPDYQALCIRPKITRPLSSQATFPHWLEKKGGIAMRTRVQKWGNSLALRIPKPFATEIGLERDSPVEVSLADGRLVIAPVVEPVLTLEYLLTRVNEDNLHGEIETGPAVGREVW